MAASAKSRFVSLFIACFLAISSPAPVSAQQGVTDTEILIGALGPLTGATGFIGTPGRDGLNLAINQINANGGINGKKLRLIFEHALTPAESVAAAKKLAEQDKVFLLILASGSTGAAAAADYVRSLGIPTYNIFGATPIIRHPFAQNVFHGAVTDAPRIAEEMVKQLLRGSRPRKIAVLAGTYAFPQSNLDAVRPVLEKSGIEFVVERFDLNAKDFTAQLTSLARQKVDAVLILGSFTEAGFAIRQAPEVGLTNVRWVLDGTAVNDAIIPIIGTTPNVRGYYNAPYFPYQKARAMEDFLAAWQAAYGKPPQGRPNIFDIIGYGSAFVLAQAIQGAGPNPTWKSLIESWEKLSDAKPSKLKGFDVTFPESFNAKDHQGNKALAPAEILSGAWTTLN